MSEKLIADVEHWLAGFPKVLTLWKNALEHLVHSATDTVRRKDAITNAHQAVDEMLRTILGNKRNPENNTAAWVNRLGIRKEWGNIFAAFESIRKEFGSHSGREAFIPEAPDAEAFVFLSGLNLRLSHLNGRQDGGN